MNFIRSPKHYHCLFTSKKKAPKGAFPSRWLRFTEPVARRLAFFPCPFARTERSRRSKRTRYNRDPFPHFCRDEFGCQAGALKCCPPAPPPPPQTPRLPPSPFS